MNAVVICPCLFASDILSRPADVLGQEIKQQGDLCLLACLFQKNEDLVALLQFDPKYCCDTITVYLDLETKRKYVMSFLDHEDGDQNIIASVLHNEGHKVHGRAVVICLTEENAIHPIGPDDVVALVIKRAWHRGVHLTSEGDMRSIEMDNAWNIRGSEVNLRLKRKKVIEDGNLLEVYDESGHHWLFAFLDKSRKVLIDLPIVCVKKS